MGAGPHGGTHGSTPGHNRFGSGQWSDNVARMHLFVSRHPEVTITVPIDNGTKDFIAVWPGGELRDTSLGWLMDKMEEQFR